MTLIDLPLSELVVESEVVDNMSYCGGARCVFFDFCISESLLQLVFFSTGIAIVAVFVAS